MFSGTRLHDESVDLLRRSTVTKHRALVPLAIIAGIALIALAILYFVDSASALPSFIPGHEAGSALVEQERGELEPPRLFPRGT